MARKSIPKPELDPESFTPSIEEGVRRLWNKNGAAAVSFAEESDNKVVKVNFAIEIDLSKSDAQTQVGIRFSQSVTDKVTFTIDDPKQGKFTELLETKPPEKGPIRGESAEPRDGEQGAEKPKKSGKAKNNPENN